MTSTPPIRSAAVLGAGTMGSQIAAHLANAGVPVVLLDMTDTLAREGLKRAVALKPDPFFTREAAALIATGGFDRDLERVTTANWIIEAVVERAEVKRALFDSIEPLLSPSSIISSNTSGIPIAALAEARSERFRRHFLGTHFFNPPRYLHLVEIIPTHDTDSSVVGRVTAFVDQRMGKGVVVAKDTPNFIANHIGLIGALQALRALESGDYTIEEIDAITGPALGRPKSATFRTLDLAGIDILAHVARNLQERLREKDARQRFELPRLVHALIDRGWIGNKAGQGFYKRAGSDILTLDPGSLSYRPKQPPRLPSLDAAKSIEDIGERIRTLFHGQEKVGAFLRRTLPPLLVYTADVTPEIAHSVQDVDRAMRWGYGWELGPFATWEAIGIEEVLAVAQPDPRPPLVDDALNHGGHFGSNQTTAPTAHGVTKPVGERTRLVKRNPGASLWDLGDGVLALDLHSKMNTIGGDTVEMLHAGLREAAANFEALVIGTEAPAFSAGANLMLVLLEAQEGNWEELDLMVRTFQNATQAIRYADVPVVCAPAGMTLGGGCEIALHADRVQAHAEAYMGLVEVGVGLIPAGGGTKEMLAREVERCGDLDEVLVATQRAFETIAFAKVSTSAANAQQLGYLHDHDSVTMNRDRLTADAKALALDRVREGHRRAAPAPIPVGGENVAAALKLGVHLAWRAARISEHDALIGRTLAHVLAGGNLPHRATVSETHLLDLEREAFLKLCGEPKTLERIRHTLRTGKPLRN